VYISLVCHTCKTIYEAYKSYEFIEEEKKNHIGHNYELSWDGEIRPERFTDDREYEPPIYEPEDYKIVDLYEKY